MAGNVSDRLTYTYTILDVTGKRDAHERLPELIAAAVRVFTREGYRLARMSDVAAEMGLSEAAIYRYVGSKEGLFVLAIPPTPWCYGKEILRQSTVGLLPDAIRLRRKRLLGADAVGDSAARMEVGTVRSNGDVRCDLRVGWRRVLPPQQRRFDSR